MELFSNSTEIKDVFANEQKKFSAHIFNRTSVSWIAVAGYQDHYQLNELCNSTVGKNKQELGFFSSSQNANYSLNDIEPFEDRNNETVVIEMSSSASCLLFFERNGNLN